ncbi:MAG: ion channel [Calditrichia bacterium]
MFQNFYKHRFAIFFITQLFVLFGALFCAPEIFEKTVLPVLIKLNIAAGIFLISKNKPLMWMTIGLFILAICIFGASFFERGMGDNIPMRLTIYSVFYIIITFQIIRQVWNAEEVDETVIIGVMSGYMCLGFLAFFMLMAIEVHQPGSFSGTLMKSEDITMRGDALMYYAFITLLTIGYGEIIPVTQVAQKAAILTGLIGQFYLVIITAIVVGKYLQHSGRPQE